MRKSAFAWGAETFGNWAPFGFGQRQRFFEFGEIRLAVLSLLKEGPKHGYQLMKEMTERSGGMYRASAGSIYPTLQQLEDEGFIESDRDEGRRTYRITVAGRNELDKDPEGVRRIWERAERWEDWGKWFSPDTVGFIAPLGQIVKSTMKAAKWAAGHHDREERLRALIKQVCSEIENLTKE